MDSTEATDPTAATALEATTHTEDTASADTAAMASEDTEAMALEDTEATAASADLPQLQEQPRADSVAQPRLEPQAAS